MIPLLGEWTTSLRRSVIASRAVDHIRTQGIIASGPFKGLPASEESLAWKWSQLLGVYEICLHQTIQNILESSPRLIVDVGAASGYYAVGMALRCPSSRVIAFESTESQRTRMKMYADRASAGNLEIRGHCGTAELGSLLSENPSGFLLMDCEGGELELLGKANLEVQPGWTILVEIHDQQAPEAANSIRSRFQSTHSIDEIWTREPGAEDFRFLMPLPLAYYCLPSLRRMCDEQRGGPMRFLCLRPKEAPSTDTTQCGCSQS